MYDAPALTAGASYTKIVEVKPNAHLSEDRTANVTVMSMMHLCLGSARQKGGGGGGHVVQFKWLMLLKQQMIRDTCLGKEMHLSP